MNTEAFIIEKRESSLRKRQHLTGVDMRRWA
jgi:hypothetical protein